MYLQRARKYASRHCLFRPEDVEDFAQDYLVSILEGKTRKLRYCYADFLRKRSGRYTRRVNVPFVETYQYENAPNPLTFDPTEIIFHKELKRYLKRLSSSQQYAIEAIMREVSYDEIAETLGVSKSRVTQLMNEALEKLSQWVKKSEVY